ncbi:MAG: sugar ABC transporter substrate-binding protein [Chloroflexi bacterium]|nr:sugar ABC transporter substrate-binding protein [Chloroflexota bacterium]
MLKKIIQIACFAIITISLFACGSSQAQDNGAPFIESTQAVSAEATNPAQTLKIALVMKTLTNPFFVEMEKGARRAETEFGIQLIVKTAAQETSIQQQIEIVGELVKQKVDAIVIAPGDSKELIPALKKAQDAGIKVVNIDNQLEAELSKKLGLVNVPFISVDNEKGAYLSAKYVSDMIKTPTNVILLEGIREARNAQDRLAGAKRAFQENPNITIFKSESANWKIDEARDVTARLFEANPEIGAIFCANDMMALGAVQYLEEQKLSNVLVAGYDNLEEAQQAIKDGKMISTIDQQAALQGYMGVVNAIKLINGETVPLVTFVDVILMTKDNVK